MVYKSCELCFFIEIFGFAAIKTRVATTAADHSNLGTQHDDRSTEEEKSTDSPDLETIFADIHAGVAHRLQGPKDNGHCQQK